MAAKSYDCFFPDQHGICTRAFGKGSFARGKQPGCPLEAFWVFPLLTKAAKGPPDAGVFTCIIVAYLKDVAFQAPSRTTIMGVHRYLLEAYRSLTWNPTRVLYRLSWRPCQVAGQVPLAEKQGLLLTVRGDRPWTEAGRPPKLPKPTKREPIILGLPRFWHMNLGSLQSRTPRFGVFSLADCVLRFPICWPLTRPLFRRLNQAQASFTKGKPSFLGKQSSSLDLGQSTPGSMKVSFSSFENGPLKMPPVLWTSTLRAPKPFGFIPGSFQSFASTTTVPDARFLSKKRTLARRLLSNHHLGNLETETFMNP